MLLSAAAAAPRLADLLLPALACTKGCKDENCSGICPFWNVPFLEYAWFGMCSKWNMIKLECALFGMCSNGLCSWNVPFLEFAQNEIWLNRMVPFWTLLVVLAHSEWWCDSALRLHVEVEGFKCSSFSSEHNFRTPNFEYLFDFLNIFGRAGLLWAAARHTAVMWWCFAASCAEA